MDAGEMLLQRFNGEEKFKIHNATMMAYKNEAGVTICFDVEVGLDSAPIQTLPDTVELAASPSAEPNFFLKELNISTLVGTRIHVPSAVDDDGERIGRFYYCEHENLSKNIVEIIDRKGDMFRVHWTGTTMDVNYYDGSKPETRVTIDAWFIFRDLDKWQQKS